MTYTITNNTQFNSVEISFDEKPSEAIRTALKDLRFRWYSVKKVWYGYSDAETVEKAIGGTKAETKTAQKIREANYSMEQIRKTDFSAPSEKKNKYGVKVGDIFSASWGYEQTNVDFFQVVALVGECSVRVREVYPKMIDETPTCGMAADRTYKITNELLPPAKHSLFIKDQENGDLKRIKPGYYKDTEQANANCHFNLSSYADAYKCNGETITKYESWYA